MAAALGPTTVQPNVGAEMTGSTIRDGRSRAEHLGGTRVRFRHPCGHSSTKDYGKGPVTKRMRETGVRLMIRWWSKGGVIAPCPRCKRADAAGERRGG